MEEPPGGPLKIIVDVVLKSSTAWKEEVTTVQRGAVARERYGELATGLSPTTSPNATTVSGMEAIVGFAEEIIIDVEEFIGENC